MDRIVEAARINRCYAMFTWCDCMPGTFEDNIALNTPRGKEVWAIFADRYKNEPHVFYEVLNEPTHGPGKWGNARQIDHRQTSRFR